MAVTLKDIAAECSLAVSTVSNILNNNKNSFASDKVKAQVRETAERLGYKKDYLSISLRTKKTNSVGICIDRVKDETRSDFIREFTDGLNAAGYEAALTDHRFDPDRLIEQISNFQERYKDGLILFTDFLGRIDETAQKKIAEKLQSIKSPVLGIGSEFKGYIPCIDIDRAWAINDALNRFNEYSEKDIVIVFKENVELREAADKLKASSYRLFNGVKAEKDFIDRFESEYSENLPKAIFFRTDAIAIPALKYFKLKDISVPDDVEIISFDNFRFSEYTDPALTSYSLNFDKLGREAFRLMNGMLAETKELERDFFFTIKPDFIERETNKKHIRRI